MTAVNSAVMYYSKEYPFTVGKKELMMYKTVEIEKNDEGKKTNIIYAINQSGNGLFHYDSYNGIYKQELGTCQFSANTPQDIIKYLKKEFPYYRFKMIRNSAKNWN